MGKCAPALNSGGETEEGSMTEKQVTYRDVFFFLSGQWLSKYTLGVTCLTITWSLHAKGNFGTLLVLGSDSGAQEYAFLNKLLS